MTKLSLRTYALGTVQYFLVELSKFLSPEGGLFGEGNYLKCELEREFTV